jgi:uncharacterized protein (DUF488 family)
MRASTIGYQETTVDAFHTALVAAGAQLLVDVRAIAASRRPGFSKHALANGVSDLAIDYLHLRGLGTPAAGRQAARAGRIDEMRDIYEAHLATPEASFEFDQLADLVRQGRHVCLLCFERDHRHCHRAVLTERLQSTLDVEVTHLVPTPPII